MDKMSCVLVFRNRKWFEKAILEINNLWQTIVNERKNGYEHRAPTKRQKKEITPKQSKCLLDIASLKIN